MKFAFLAASALALSVPALAQDGATTPPPAEQDTMQTQDTTQDPATQDPAMQTPPAADPSTAADPSMQTPPPAGDPAMQTPPAGDPSMQTQGATGTTTGTMTQGGYAPSTPPMSGQPGGQVVVRPSAPVAQAFPPPPAKESYPTCSRTVTDGCRNPGGR